MSSLLPSDFEVSPQHLPPAPPFPLPPAPPTCVTLCGGGAHTPPATPLPLPPAPVSRRDLAAPSPLLDDVVSRTPPPHLAAPSSCSAPSPLPPSAPAMLLLQAQVDAKTQSVSASHVLAAVENERKGTPPPPQCKLPASDANTRTALGQRYMHAHAAAAPVSRLASSPAPATLAAPVAATRQAPLPRTKVFFFCRASQCPSLSCLRCTSHSAQRVALYRYAHAKKKRLPL